MIVKKVVEVPKINKIYKKVPRERVIDVYEDVVVDNYSEVPKDIVQEIEIPLSIVQDKVNTVEERYEIPIYTRVKRSHLSQDQLKAFDNSARELADAKINHQMLMKELEYIEKRIAAERPERIPENQAKGDELRTEIRRLRDQLVAETRSRDIMRDEIQKPPEIEVKENPDRSMIPDLQRNIRSLREKNQVIRNFLEDAKHNPSTRSFVSLHGSRGPGSLQSNYYPAQAQKRVATQAQQYPHR